MFVEEAHTLRRGVYMRYTLENEAIQISADTRGGELVALNGKKSGAAYLWNGDPAYWKYRAPILFPIVGKVIGGKYRANGKTYALPPHGLARISDFTLAEKTDRSIAFELSDSSESLAAYPYRFRLQVAYALDGNAVETTLRVENPSADTMYFCIGAHPAFMCPIDPGDLLEDCYLAFSEKETASITPLSASGYLSKAKAPFLKGTNRLALKRSLFHNDALIFDELKSKEISICSSKNDRSLTVELGDFPYVGIWAPKDGAPFLCIEPWRGHADVDGFDGELKDKPGVVALGAKEAAAFRYRIRVAESS